MKKLMLILLLLSVPAFGGETIYRWTDGYRSSRLPPLPGLVSPAWADYVAAGVRIETPEELAAYEAQQEEDQSSAAHQMSLPAPFPTGVEVSRVVFQSYTNGWGWAMEAIDQGTTAAPPDTIFYLFHASPVHWPTVNSNRSAAIAALEAKKSKCRAAKSMGGGLPALSARLDAYDALFGIKAAP
jgi:hypothetical protein